MEGRETTDTRLLKLWNRRKLRETKNMYHIDGSRNNIFRYIHDSAFPSEN